MHSTDIIVMSEMRLLQEVESIKLEKEELTKDIEQCREQIVLVEETIKGFESHVAELREVAEKVKVSTFGVVPASLLWVNPTHTHI